MSMFVVVGQSGLRIASSDGLEWKNQQLGRAGETYRAVAYGNSVFAAVGGFGYGDQIMAASGDGLTWTTTAKVKATNYRSIFFGNGKFLAMSGDPAQVGDAKPVVATSTDGVKWTEPKRISGQWLLRRLAYGNNTFFGAGDRGRRSVSTDGLTWTDVPNTKAIDTLVDVTFGNGIFVGVGLHGLRTSSRDGLTWSEPQRGKEGEHLNSIVFAAGRFLAVGAGATFTSTDGETWTRTPNQNAPFNCVFGNGVFVGTNWKGRILNSPDAIVWKEALKCPHHVEGVAFGTF
jgi:hypothetical protein